MKTDSLLYRIFRTAPSIFFELIGQPNLQGYEFQSIEVKQTAHRIDGVFCPPPDQGNLPVFFAEFQFQEDELFYHRLFAEIFLYLEQNPHIADWQAVVLFPRRSLEPTQTQFYEVLLQSPKVRRFYLNELSEQENLSVSLGLLKLIVTTPRKAPDLAKALIQQTKTQPELPAGLLLELILMTMVYKFPELSREEILEMLEIVAEAKQTRFYQEVKEEGRQEGLQAGLQVGRQEGLQAGRQEGLQAGRQEGLQVGRQEGLAEGERSLILRLLTRRWSTLRPEIQSQIEALSLEQLESLADVLLDFSTPEDLQQWLQEKGS